MRLRVGAAAPPVYSTDALLSWLRGNAPDLRILRGIVDGRRVVAAQFTFGGLRHEYAVTEGTQPDESFIADAEDAVIRTCYLAMARAMGLPTVTREATREMERQVLTAAAIGDSERAEAIGRELALLNDERTRPAQRLQSMFGRRQAW